MADNVTLRHPSGKFGVTVDAARADTLRSRGYTSETLTLQAPSDIGGGTEVTHARVATPSTPTLTRKAGTK